MPGIVRVLAEIVVWGMALLFVVGLFATAWEWMSGGWEGWDESDD